MPIAQVKPLKFANHVLWCDGTIQVIPENAADYTIKLAGKANKLAVTEITSEIAQFNKLSDHPLQIKVNVDSVFPPEWVIPERYKYLDLDGYLFSLAEKIEEDNLYEKRVERLSHEIWLFREENLYDVLRVLIYIVDTMKEKNIIWGVGRGSSCSSYLLFLLGLHEVDSVKYDIEITDFIKQEK